MPTPPPTLDRFAAPARRNTVTATPEELAALAHRRLATEELLF